MNAKRIIILLDEFAKGHGFIYNRTPVACRPYGEVKGKISNTDFNFHIYQPEDRINAPIISVFAIPEAKSIPTGFCIEHGYSPYSGRLPSNGCNRPFPKSKTFEEQINNLSYNENIVTTYLTDETKSLLIQSFAQLKKLEATLFQSRSCLRISDRGISLMIGRVFSDLDSFAIIFHESTSLLVNIRNNLR